MPHIVRQAHGGGDLTGLGLADGAASGSFDEGDVLVRVGCHYQGGGGVDAHLDLGGYVIVGSLKSDSRATSPIDWFETGQGI